MTVRAKPGLTWVVSDNEPLPAPKYMMMEVSAGASTATIVIMDELIVGVGGKAGARIGSRRGRYIWCGAWLGGIEADDLGL